MFVYNLKVNKSSFFKIFKIAILILGIVILAISIISILKCSNNENHDISNSTTDYIELNSKNYTNFLKDSHEDISTYLGHSVKITGYVYRLPDFSDNQFVLARTMLINSNSQAVVVGILCDSSEAKNFENYEWVEIRGVVEKGNYHGDLPILKINEIKKAKTPEDEFVYEPTD